MEEKREVDILDLLPPEAVEVVNKAGFAFLCEHGYDAEGAEEDEIKQKAISAELSRRGERFEYHGMVDGARGKFLIWFNLWHGKKRIARSEGHTFILRGENGNE